MKTLIYTMGSCVIMLLAACTKDSTHPLDTLRIDVGAEAPSLDPNKAEDVNSSRIMYDLFAGLLDFDQKNQLQPGMARNWDISADGKTYTFHLRDDLKFSDGSPITAADFMYSWQRLVNPKTSSSYSFLLSGVENAQAIIAGKQAPQALGVSAPESLTLVVKLTAADDAFLDKVAMPNLYVVSQNVIEKHPQNWTTPEFIVTSGAYTLKEHVVNGYILASKNPYYYAAAAVKIPQVKYLPLVDLNASVATYKTGDLDITFQMLPVDQYPVLKQAYPEEVHTIQQEAIGVYEFNITDPQLGKNLKLRQALSMAIDREALTQEVLQDGKTPLYAVVTPTIDNGSYAKLAYPWANWHKAERIQRAQQLYAEAGYGPEHPYKFTITYNTNEMYKKISLALAAMWKDTLGAEATIQNQDWKTFLQTRHKGAYQVARGGWFADYNNITTYTLLYQCANPQNDTHWCDATYDQLLATAATTKDAKLRRQYYFQALQRAQDAYIIIPLFQFSFNRMIKPYIQGYDLEQNYLDHVQSKWMQFN